MRTRTANPSGQGWAARPRWAATAAPTAATGLAKAAKNESPSVLTSTPSRSRMARRRMAACSARTAG